jgi:hypothetical protein
VLLEGGIEIDISFQLLKLLVESNPARWQRNKPGTWVENLSRVDELKLDAFGASLSSFVDERPRPSKIALVRGAELGDDKAGISRADGSARERDHHS